MSSRTKISPKNSSNMDSRGWNTRDNSIVRSVKKDVSNIRHFSGGQRYGKGKQNRHSVDEFGRTRRNSEDNRKRRYSDDRRQRHGRATSPRRPRHSHSPDKARTSRTEQLASKPSTSRLDPTFTKDTHTTSKPASSTDWQQSFNAQFNLPEVVQSEKTPSAPQSTLFFPTPDHLNPSQSLKQSFTPDTSSKVVANSFPTRSLSPTKTAVNVITNHPTTGQLEITHKLRQLEEENRNLRDEKIANCTCVKDKAIVELIKENMEKVRLVQEQESERLNQEKLRRDEEEQKLSADRAKLDQERTELKLTLDRGMQMLENHRLKQEAELKAKQDSATNQQLDQLKAQISTLQSERQKEKGLAEEEAKRRRIQTELAEIEAKEKIEKLAKESKARIEDLESRLKGSTTRLAQHQTILEEAVMEKQTVQAALTEQLAEVARLKAKSSCTQSDRDDDYRVFLEKKATFDENARIRCVFCPQDNRVSLTNFLFHIAREHMFDQYKKVNIESDTIQVGMLLKILEDKARKEFSQKNSLNINKSNVSELQNRVQKLDSAQKESEKTKKQLEKKVTSLEADIECLLTAKIGQEEEIEALVTKNNTLANQVQGFNSVAHEGLKLENVELKSQLNKCVMKTKKEMEDAKRAILGLEKERNVLKQRLMTEGGEKFGMKNKMRELCAEKDMLVKRLSERERNFNESRGKLRSDLKSANDERSTLRQKVDRLEAKVMAISAEKSNLESRLSSAKSEIAAIKEFRSDVSSINEIMLEEARLENRKLTDNQKQLNEEKRNLQTKVSNLKSTSEELLREISNLRDESSCMKTKLSEQTVEIQRKTEDNCRLQALNSELESQNSEKMDFLNFDPSLECLLKTNLDIISLPLESVGEFHDRSLELYSREDKSVNSKKAGQQISVPENTSVATLNQKTVDVHALTSDKEDCEVVATSAVDESSLPPDFRHGRGCDCVECDDVDYLHGFLNNKPFGIKEMMESLQQEMTVPLQSLSPNVLLASTTADHTISDVDELLDSDDDYVPDENDPNDD